MAMFTPENLCFLDDVASLSSIRMNSAEQQSPINVQNVSVLLDCVLKSTYKARDADGEVCIVTATPLSSSFDFSFGVTVRHFGGLEGLR